MGGNETNWTSSFSARNGLISELVDELVSELIHTQKYSLHSYFYPISLKRDDPKNPIPFVKVTGGDWAI
ncbi:hypothetical protein JANAI62_21910 [Jannaschia pagri]|uniref:Uncharacterized protein n=1 Tax=Jannaschia pagri TaxID=2829797 RepID=A0ABQ4NMF7_9RHOB|nr:hypothetical protein JANAI61_21920 [Jannaschia sp. AI_61]GIT95568.1 hypothetical protein JANAI62_21910 [Jannaschia sp. AI_62]